MKTKVMTALVAALLLTHQNAAAQWSHREGDSMPHPPGILVQPFARAEWDASNFADAKDLQWFRDAKFGMFIHFGLSTRHNADLSWGTCHTRKAPDTGNGPIADAVWQAFPNEFRFEKFNAAEWVAIARQAGCKDLVAIAKHHDGFHLWDTAFSDFKVTRTPFKRDYLKELADACHAANMPFGIYYSQRDWYHPDYMPVDPAKVKRNGVNWALNPGETSPLGDRHQKYIEYQFNAVRELCRNYGKVDIFWWDAAWWSGSTRRGDKAWLHVTQWPGETLRLPAIPGRTVKSARLSNGDTVAFRQTGAMLALTVPRPVQNPVDTIVELTFDQPLDGLPAIAAGEYLHLRQVEVWGK
jgi:alpha-L-fucosidase